MRNPTQSYAHRGDRLRRNDRIKKVVLVAGLLIAVALVPRQRPEVAQASAGSAFTLGLTSESRRLRNELDAAKGELALAKARLDRANRVMAYSSRYHIGADLAGAIYDISQAEGIEPGLAFRLVKVESEFNEHATSPVGALGLTQLMPSTARYFQKGLTREQIYDRDTNLRIGFRYLRSLIREYHGNVRLALLVYNRGPLAVETLRSLGLDPHNGYDDAVLAGYHGTGIVN
ncbi:MAG TPA: lytic transglycosylase domain-containing protein [Gemmatimonadaceae bacterium]